MTAPTLSQLGEMTDEELNVRLMKCLGWHELDESYKQLVRESHMLTPDKRSVTGIKDFSTDANAVAEVRKGLSQDQQEWVCGKLYWLVIPKEDHFPDHFISWSHVAKICNAPLRQIVIAIIAALTP
jgi:hypothetical protein